MAYPTILADSATGSDTAASGAGPSTALTGTAGATDGAGTTVTLDAGTDLSGVDTTGLHVIYINNTTTGARNFAKITSKAGSGGATPTVGVAEAFAFSLSGKTWAIGGKRASVFAGTSLRLTDNNSAAGDAMPGWTIQMQSGHAESLSATASFNRLGDTTSGPITLQGDPAYTVRPVLTWTANVVAISGPNPWGGIHLRGFKARNTNATKTTSMFIGPYAMTGMVFEDLVIGDSTDYFGQGISGGNTNGDAGSIWIRCTFTKTSSNIDLFGWNGCASVRFFNCSFLSAGGSGAGFAMKSDAQYNVTFFGCIFSGCGYGIYDSKTGGYSGPTIINSCTFNSCTNDGLRTPALINFSVANSIFSNNGGYGINFASRSAQGCLGTPVVIRNCCFPTGTGANTSGKYPSGYSILSLNESNANPTFVSSSDLTPTNTALQAALQASP